MVAGWSDRFSEPGRVLELSAVERLWLEGGRALYRVDAGEVDLFLVERDSEGHPGRRHFVTTCRRGRLLPAWESPSAGAGWVLLAIGQPGSRVALIDAALPSGDESPAAASALLDGLMEWLDGLCAPFYDLQLPADCAAQLAPSGQPDIDRFLAVQRHQVAELVERFAAFDAAERSRFAARAQSEERVMEAGVRSLAAVLRRKRRRAELRVGEPPWFAACRLVGEASHLQLQLPEADLDACRDPLAVIERCNRIRRRAVALEGEWWRGDNGPLVGSWLDGSPVALLPRRDRRSYEVVDPATGERQRVDAALHERLMDRAYSLYRPFGDLPLRPSGIVRFAMAGLWGDLAWVGAAAVAATLLGLVVPVAIGLLVDEIIPSAERQQLLDMALILFALAVAQAMFGVTRAFTQLRLKGKAEMAVQSAVWDRLLRLQTAFFRDYSAGDLESRANAVNAIRQELSGTALNSILSSLFSLIALGLMLVYSGVLTLVAIGVALFAVALNGVATWISLYFRRRMVAQEGALSGMTLELLSGVSKIRATGAERRAFVRWAEAFAIQQDLSYRAGTAVRPIAVLEAAFPLLSTALLFTVISAMAPTEAPSTGEFLAFSAAQGTFIGGILGLAQAVAGVIGIVPLWERGKPILEAVPEGSSGQGEPGELQGRIEVHDVVFRYDVDAPPTLKGLSLYAQPGEFIGIVGTSGSGKSTLLRILLGFEQPESGGVYYDGQDLAGLDVTAVRQQIGVVLQNGYLAAGDIFQNIVGAAPLTVEDAWAAVEMAGLEDDIRKLPMGLNTMVSEGGGTLSGGQRQRLLIARALVHRPAILFFDEATSALDNTTQAQVNASVARLAATRVVIAHRLSTIQHADRIYVIDQGAVAEAGSYAELLAAGGLFADLARRQMV